jgi:hypothetical protein
MSFSVRARLTRTLVFAGTVLLLPAAAQSQARTPAPARPAAASRLWIAPYFGAGFQNNYYDGLVQFSDASSAFLTLDPGTSTVLGVQLGYRLSPKWSVQGSLSTAAPNASYIENLTLRPDQHLRTTQIDAGLLYDAAALRVGKDKAPITIGGGLSLTSHSIKNFLWNGNTIRPGATSVGAHVVAGLDIPLAPKVSFHSQAKLSLTPLSRGDLEEKIGAAQGGGVTATLDGGTSTYFQLNLGAAYRP